MTDAAVPSFDRAALRDLARQLRRIAEHLEATDRDHADEAAAWTMHALEAVGEASLTLTPAVDSLLFFGQQIPRLTQTDMAKALGLTPSAVSRRLSLTATRTDMAARWSTRTRCPR